VAVLAMIAYLLAGLLHGVCDLDVTNPSSHTVIALSADDGAHQKQNKKKLKKVANT